MRISISFYTLKDLSDLSYEKRFLENINSYGLIIERADEHEPVRKEFNESNFEEIWKGRKAFENDMIDCYFLFKGKKDISFSGMLTWNLNLHPRSQAVNAIHLWFNVPKNYDINKIVQLSEDLFTWSEAVYGYITEDFNEIINNIYGGIGGLMWINYFGTPYIKESYFNIPDNSIRIANGIKLILSDKPSDEILRDNYYLYTIKNKIGLEWFLECRKNRKIPCFDRSEITNFKENY